MSDIIGEQPDEIIPINEPEEKAQTITETITVHMNRDITKSQYIKVMRQCANILHALLANSMRYAAIKGGMDGNAGAGAQVTSSIFQAAAQCDMCSIALENSQRQVIGGQQMPPGGGRGSGGGLIGRA